MINVSEAKTMPAKTHRFEKRTAACRLLALISMSDIGSLPGLVIKRTGYVSCLLARRIQISDENEESTMALSLLIRKIWASIRSMKVLISIAIGPTPASTASWMRGYSLSMLAFRPIRRAESSFEHQKHTDLDIEADWVRQLRKQLFQRGERILHGMPPCIRLVPFVLEVHGVLHSFPNSHSLSLLVLANECERTLLLAGPCDKPCEFGFPSTDTGSPLGDWSPLACRNLKN